MLASNNNKHDDLELVALYQQTNDNIHVANLFQRYTHLIFGVCMKYFKNEMEAQDASMQIFEKLLIDLKKHKRVWEDFYDVLIERIPRSLLRGYLLRKSMRNLRFLSLEIL